MKQVLGVWLPDGEAHMAAWMEKVRRMVDGRGTYQYHKLERALQEVTRWRRAVDVGAHCGTWSMHLAREFDRLVAFEPVAAHCECFERNVGGNYDLHRCALGEIGGTVSLHYDPTNTGDTHVAGPGGLEVPCLVFDELYPDLADVDFVKLDCEGFELFALRGMRRMLERCRPVVVVEQKPGRATKYRLPETGAVDFLQELGARLVVAMSGDYVLRW